MTEDSDRDPPSASADSGGAADETGPTLRNVREDAVDHRTAVEGPGVEGNGTDADDPNATIDQFVDGGGYLVEVKRSARKRNPAVGEAVFESGAYHRFSDREAADEWAGALADAGERTVWIQDAPPHDETPFDGYLVGRRPIRPAEAPFESEQTSLPNSP